jgi:hypothetical protein
MAGDAEAPQFFGLEIYFSCAHRIDTAHAVFVYASPHNVIERNEGNAVLLRLLTD